MPTGVGDFLFGARQYICLSAKNELDFQVTFGYTYETEYIRLQGDDEYYANSLGPIHLSKTPTIAEGTY